MKTISSLITSRYLALTGKDRTIAFMMCMCFAGIAIGTFSLMLALIIFNGFEKVIHEKMQGINAQVIVYAPGSRLDYQNLRATLLKEFPGTIQAISGNTTKQALIDHNQQQSVIFMRGIDTTNEASVSAINQKIIHSAAENAPRFDQLLKGPSIIIGHKMALQLHLSQGDQLTLLIPEASGQKKIALKTQTVTITGTFNIGLEEYDNNFAFCSIDFLNTLFEEQGADQLTIKLRNLDDHLHMKGKTITDISFWTTLWEKCTILFSRLIWPYDPEAKAITLLQERLPHLVVCSWKDQYPALVSSLKLEKYVMFFILALITIVACMNMISLLFMQIQNKRRDIAIFKAMGMADNTIKNIFLGLGMRLTCYASLTGLTLAAIAGVILERYPFITLPDVYYVSYLPARMDPELFIIVFIATMLMGFLATWIPARQSKSINISQVLRQ